MINKKTALNKKETSSLRGTVKISAEDVEITTSNKTCILELEAKNLKSGKHFFIIYKNLNGQFMPTFKSEIIQPTNDVYPWNMLQIATSSLVSDVSGGVDTNEDMIPFKIEFYRSEMFSEKVKNIGGI